MPAVEARKATTPTEPFHRELNPNLRADYVLANPTFNDSDTALRDSAFLRSEASPQVVSEAKDNFRKDDDVTWQFAVPPKGNANFAWVQHFIYAGFNTLAGVCDALLLKLLIWKLSVA